MTSVRLQEAALARFARQGFDATSLAEIAQDVGIKKPSIYAHFNNKDGLYLSLIPLMVFAELEYARNTLCSGKSAKTQIHIYLQSIKTRFDDSYHVQFWMRALFMPPGHIYDQAMAPMHVFMDDMEALLTEVIQDSDLVPNACGLSTDTLVKTCMGLIDSLQCELIYGGPDKFEKRLKALWSVFDAATTAVPTQKA